MDAAVLLVRVVLAGVFGLAAITKLADLTGSKDAMRNFGLPNRLAAPAGIALPLVELAIAIFLLPVGTAWWGALAGLILMLRLYRGHRLHPVAGANSRLPLLRPGLFRAGWEIDADSQRRLCGARGDPCAPGAGWAGGKSDWLAS